eukprot:5044274-Amphidinium_carterae.1
MSKVRELRYFGITDYSLYRVMELACDAPGTKEWKGQEHATFVLRGRTARSVPLLDWSVGQ